MTPMRLQGVIFSIFAFLTVCFSMLSARLTPQNELIIIAVLIVVLGVPHGALDIIFARKLYNTHSLLQWLRFSLAYLCLALFVVGIWLFSPLVFLIGFLTISLAHFSGDLRKNTPLLIQVAYGGAILVLPMLFHAEEVTQLFALLGGSEAANRVARILQVLSWPWLFACSISVAVEMTKDRYTALELFAVVVLAVASPPLISFTVFFCLMHSARHVMRTLKFAASSSVLFRALAAMIPTVSVLVMSLIGWRYLPESAFDSRIVRFVFVGLAALTLPHMVLIEQARLAGWLKGEIHG